MSDEYKNLIIGTFVFAALSIVVFILLYLHPSVGDEKQVLYVWFSDIDKVNVGTRVTFAGKPVGEVGEIILKDLNRSGPHDGSGHLYTFKLKLLIDSHIEVYDTDQISLRTSGLLGERSVSITPVAPPPGVTPRLIRKNEILYAVEAGSVEETMKEFKDVADKLELALDQVTKTLEDVRKEEVIKNLGEVLRNVNDITAAFNKPEELASIVTNLHDFTSTLAERITPSWNTLDDSLIGFKQTMDIARLGVGDMQMLIGDIKLGKGTFGNIFVKEDLYLQLKSTLSKADTIMNDINHYGLLFHSDKGWQRLRARRLNLLETLSSPQEFRNYFNDEMDQISTSLSRVYMVLDQTERCGCPPCAVGGDPDFRKVFAELLRRAEVLEENLKSYNEQMTQAQMRQTELSRRRCCY